MKSHFRLYIRQQSFFCVLLLSLFSNYSTAKDQALDKALQAVGIQVTTHLGDHQTFRKNDVVSFLLSLERDAYLTAIYVDAENNLYQIIPNASQRDHYFKANLFIPIPPKNADYNFKIKPPYGKETLWVFASDADKIRLKGDNLANGMIKLTQTLDEVRTVLKRDSIDRFDEASVHIITSED